MRINFFVFLDDEQLLEPVNDSNIYSSRIGNTIVVPCKAKNPAVKVELHRVIPPMDHRLVSASETMLQSVHKFCCQPLSHFNIQRPCLNSLKLKIKITALYYLCVIFGRVYISYHVPVICGYYNNLHVYPRASWVTRSYKLIN